MVPRPSHAIPTSMDKTKALSETTRLGSLRRVLTKSIGIQTVSAPKVSTAMVLKLEETNINLIILMHHSMHIFN